MRITLELDDDVVAAARALAGAEGRSLGRVISDLACGGLRPPPLATDEEEGFPVSRLPPGSPPITDRMLLDVLEYL